MLQWPKPKTVTKTVFVPTSLSDTRSYIDKWHDEVFLRSAMEIGMGETYKTEILQALTILREKADNAKSIDEYNGIKYGLRLLKDLLTISERAKHALTQGAELETVYQMGEEVI